jgi:hypothetical protein
MSNDVIQSAINEVTKPVDAFSAIEILIISIMEKNNVSRKVAEFYVFSFVASIVIKQSIKLLKLVKDAK